MRYYGTLTGRLSNASVEKVYEREESPKTFAKFFVECVDVNAEDGTHYDRLLISTADKSHICGYLIPNNKISFDCRSVKDGIVTGCRNICANYMRSGTNVLTKDEFDMNIPGGFCIDCTYRNKKKSCEKYNSLI